MHYYLDVDRDSSLWETCQIQLNKIHCQFLQLFYSFVCDFTLQTLLLWYFYKNIQIKYLTNFEIKREDIRIPLSTLWELFHISNPILQPYRSLYNIYRN